MTIFLAIILGLLFGFVLQKSGAADPHVITDMLRLKDFHLMKTISLAIGTSSLALYILLAMGIIDVSHLGVKSSYVGVIAGGAILGLGWAIAGFCPGTGVVALGTGRKDALFFVLGGLVGAFVFTLMYASLKSTFLFDDLGGKATLVRTGSEKFIALLPSLPAVLIAGVLAILFIFFAIQLPEKRTS
ncbi:MAG: YeeE/YedE family protein [Methylococcaceae bacterium]|nr:YeeE/YedE family protein [Methylococcaceae bacterium]